MKCCTSQAKIYPSNWKGTNAFFYSIRYVPEPCRFNSYCPQCNGINEIVNTVTNGGERWQVVLQISLGSEGRIMQTEV